MSFTRRQLIEGSIATGALALVSSTPLFAQSINRPLFPPATSPVSPFTPAAAPLPAQPRVIVDPIVDARLVARARAAYDRHRSQVAFGDVVGIVDFSKASATPRFYLLDTVLPKDESHLVAHGRGSDPSHTGFLQRFSNAFGSEASSEGAYVTGEFYQGSHGRSMRVRGLDYTNSNAEARAIVVHGAWYAEPDVVASTGRLGRSEGCFTLPHTSLQETFARLGAGRFLYADRLA